MTTPDNPFAAATEAMQAARARWQQARQGGDDVEIEIARADLREAMAALDAQLDDFEETVLGGRFRRKRDLQPGCKSTGSTVLRFRR